MFPNLERRHLHVFVAVAEELHFGRASKRLGVSQPAVTQTIQALEEELAVALFDRTHRNVQLTTAGKRFVVEARHLLARFDRAGLAAQEAARLDAGTLTVGFSGALSLSPLPRLLAEFRRSHPLVQLHFVPMSSQAQVEAIVTGRCDLGCPFAKLEAASGAGLVVLDWQVNPLVAVLPASDPRSREKGLSFRDLARDPVITLSYENEPSLSDMFRMMVRKEGWEANIAFEVNHLDATLALIGEGLGISFLPRTVTAFRSKNVRFVPLVPAIDIPVTLMWSPRNFNPSLADLLALIGHQVGGERAK